MKLEKNQRLEGSQLITVLADGRVRVETINEEPSLTQQQYAKQSDINEIMRRYEQTGEMNLKNSGLGTYMDLVGLPDYQESLHTVQKAQDAFMSLPAQVRKRFENDPSQLIHFLQDPKNKSEAQQLGLIDPDPVVAPKDAIQRDQPAKTP